MSFKNITRLNPKRVSRVLGSLLYEQLGEYTYSDGSNRKAVSIGKPNKDAKVDGLELIVPVTPNMSNQYEEWCCYLIDKTGESTGQLFESYERIRCSFTVVPRMMMLPANAELGNYDQLVLKLDQSQLNWLARRLKL